MKNAMNQYKVLSHNKEYPFPFLDGLELDQEIEILGTKDFNYIKDFKKIDLENKSHSSDILYDEEGKIWGTIKNTFENLDQKLAEYQELGVSILNWENMEFHKSIYDWISSVRDLLSEYEWEDVSVQTICEHIEHLFLIFPYENMSENNLEFEKGWFDYRPSDIDIYLKFKSTDHQEGNNAKSPYGSKIHQPNNSITKKRKREMNRRFDSKDKVIIDDDPDPDIKAVVVDGDGDPDNFSMVDKKNKKIKGSLQTNDKDINQSLVKTSKATIKLSHFKKFVENPDRKLNTYLEFYLKFWFRSLIYLLRRKNEASNWMFNARNIKNFDEDLREREIANLINIGKFRNIPKKYLYDYYFQYYYQLFEFLISPPPLPTFILFSFKIN